MKKIQAKNPAFSFVELLLYVAITSTIAVSLLLFSINIVSARGEAEKEREVLENARLVMEKITREVHDAEAVSTGTFGSHPGSLTLTLDGAGGSFVIDTSTKLVGSDTIRYLRWDGTQITSDKVNISNFVLNDMTRGTEVENIQVEFSMESLDGTYDLDLQTSISLRE